MAPTWMRGWRPWPGTRICRGTSFRSSFGARSGRRDALFRGGRPQRRCPGRASPRVEMSNCCPPPEDDAKHPRKRCPVCRNQCGEVSARTIAHHVANAWDWAPTANRHFFCDAPGCEVVYFDEGGTIIPRSRLRTRVGVKEEAGDALLCYCFGVDRDAFQRNPAVKQFVMAQTKAGLCSCDTSNPSGRCCLKDFPKRPP
ncbi:MAG TPA: hypothetical protein VF801_14545 [Rhodocyclaceae bacterium]